MQYYLALKRKKILAHAQIWVNLETQKDKHCVIPHTAWSEVPRDSEIWKVE